MRPQILTIADPPVAGPTGRLAILAAPLNTTLDAAAIGLSRAAALRNCDTSRGTFGRDKRYKRVQVPPSATIIGEACTNLLAPSSGASAARSGSTVPWSNPSNAIPPDGVFASAVMEVADVTESLVMSSFAATGLTSGLTLTRLRLQVLARATAEEDDAPVQVVDDLVRLTISGTPVGANAATLTPLTETATVREYEWDAAALGVTAAQIIAGNIGAVIGYKALPEEAADPESWNIAYSVAGTARRVGLRHPSLAPFDTTVALTGTTGLYTAGQAEPDEFITSAEYCSGTITTTVEWDGVGDAPSAVCVQLYSHSRAGTNGDIPDGANVNDGQGGTEITNPVAERETTKKYVLTVTSDEASKALTLSASAVRAEAGDDTPMDATIEVEATITDPDPATVEVDSVQFIACYETEVPTTTDPQGIGLGRFAGEIDIAAVIGGGAFDIPASASQGAMGDDWRDERSGTQLDAGNWSIWQFANWLFYAHPIGGVYRRTIGEDDWEPVYKDSESPGSTGDATATSVAPPYDEYQVFDPSVDEPSTPTSITTAGVAGLTAQAQIDADDGLLYIRTNDWIPGVYNHSWLWPEVTLGTPRDLSKAMAIGVKIETLTPDDEIGGNDGFSDKVPFTNSIRLTNSLGDTSYDLTLRVHGEVNKKHGTYFGWADLSIVDQSVLEDVEKIKIKFGIYQTGRGNYRVSLIYAGGTFYHDTDTDPNRLGDQNENNVEKLEYAYDYSEGSTLRRARKLIIPAKTHLGGSRMFTGTYPYLGSVQSIRVPTADSPYTSAATINLYRKVGDDYQRIATGPNTDDLVFEDRLPDSVLAADTTTYPVTIMDFSDAPPSDSGVATGITCGCAWKGSNVYAGNDGKVYFSATGDATTVEWDNVVLTNDPGSGSLGPPRTSTVADDTTSPVIALVPAENLYCFTRTEAYVFVSGDTAYTASFPRKIDGVRGAIGQRAACSYGDRALVGCDDGLWLVKKSTSYGEQADELIEVTAEVRPSWKWLLGDSPATTVVRHVLGEIWAFNGARYLHITREQNPIEGEFTDGRSIVDAVADSEHGLILLLSDGHLGLIGDFPTDGGTNLGGTDGAAFEWSYLTGLTGEGKPLRAHVHYLTEAEAAAVTVKAITERGDSERSFTSSAEKVANTDFSRSIGGGFSQYEIKGGPQDRVRRLTIEFHDRPATRGNK